MNGDQWVSHAQFHVCLCQDSARSAAHNLDPTSRIHPDIARLFAVQPVVAGHGCGPARFGTGIHGGVNLAGMASPGLGIGSNLMVRHQACVSQPAVDQ